MRSAVEGDIVESRFPQMKRTGDVTEMIGTRLRILTHPAAEIPGFEGRSYNDAEVIAEFKEYNFSGKARANPIVLVDLGKEIPRTKVTHFPVRFLMLRSAFSVPLSIVRDGYWVEVIPFAVNPDALDVLTEKAIDLDDVQTFERMSPQMSYLTPCGRDPYVERWIPHRLMGAVRTEPQPYGEKWPNVFDVTVETEERTPLRGYTREDDLAAMAKGSVVNLNYYLVNCSEVRRDDPSAVVGFQRRASEGVYAHEVRGGIVRALWWPEQGVFKNGDLAGRMFTLQVGDTFVRLEDSLDKRKEIGTISVSDCIRAVGQLEFTWRHEDRILAMYENHG